MIKVSTRRLAPCRPSRSSQVPGSGFLRGGTRLRRVRGTREIRAESERRACLVGPRRGLAGRIVFIGVMAVLVGAGADSMAAPAEPDGSRERPYPRLGEAAERVVATARNALDQYWDGVEEPRLAVAATESVSPDVIEAVQVAMSGAGERQTAGGSWLEVITNVQNTTQGIIYEPAPRAELVQPDLVLAIDETHAGPDLRLVRGALLTLRAEGSEWSGAGEVVPDSSTSVYVGKAPEPGAADWLTASGTGYCNRKISQDRWRYTAMRAAEVNARAALARARCGETVEGSHTSQGQQLTDDTQSAKVECTLSATWVMSEHFDASSCRAVVTMTDRRPAPGTPQDKGLTWQSFLTSASVKVIFSLATGGI